MTSDRPWDRYALPLLLLLATSAGWLFRQWAGYPPTPSDERNWVAIAALVADGANWPISGPLHFETTKVLADRFDTTHENALAMQGLLSIPAVLLAYAGSYRLMGFTQAWPSLLLLCTSTYFWAPLLESRPQQWGQALVMLCATMIWHLLNKERIADWRAATGAWFIWSALFALTCWVHLLSAALALAWCAMLGLLLVVLHPERLPRLASAAIASLPGLMVLSLPQGPYQMMWFDIRHNHVALNLNAVWLPLLVGALVVAAMTLMRNACLRTMRHCLFSIETQPRRWVVALSVLTVLAIAAQASMLPSKAWAFYQASFATAMLRHLGNLFFFACFVLGAVSIFSHRATRAEQPWPGQTALLMCAVVIAVAALAASTVLRDTNWMLRVINYALPIAAPFAAIGLSRWRSPASVKVGALCLTWYTSLLFAGLPAFVW